MTPPEHTPLLEAEIENFKLLDEKIDKILQRMAELKEERDTAVRQKEEMESLLRSREKEISRLEDNLKEVEDRSQDQAKETLIKEKLSNLLHKLEKF